MYSQRAYVHMARMQRSLCKFYKEMQIETETFMQGVIALYECNACIPQP